MEFKIKKSQQFGRGPYVVIEDGYHIFEGTQRECATYVRNRKNGWDVATATKDAKHPVTRKR